MKYLVRQQHLWTNKFLNILDGLPWNFVKIFFIFRGGILAILVIRWSLLNQHQQVIIFHISIGTKFNKDIHGSGDVSYWLWWSPDFSSGMTMKTKFLVLTEVSQQLLDEFAMKSGGDVHVPLKMNCNIFGNPLTFHLVPSSGQNFK